MIIESHTGHLDFSTNDNRNRTLKACEIVGFRTVQLTKSTISNRLFYEELTSDELDFLRAVHHYLEESKLSTMTWKNDD